MKDIQIAPKFFIASFLIVSFAHAESVYKCGNLYTSLPCKNGKRLEAPVSKYVQPKYPELENQAVPEEARAQLSLSKRDKKVAVVKKEIEKPTSGIEIRGGGLTTEQLQQILGIAPASSGNPENNE